MNTNEQMKTDKNEKEVIELQYDMEEDDHGYEKQTDDEENDQEVARQQDESEVVTGMDGIEGFEPENALHAQRAPKTGAGAMSIAFIWKDDKCFVIVARNVIGEMGNPETVQVTYSDHEIVIAEYIGEKFTDYVLKASGFKHDLVAIFEIDDLDGIEEIDDLDDIEETEK